MGRPSTRRRTWSAAGKGSGIKMKGGTLSAILLQTKVEGNNKKKKQMLCRDEVVQSSRQQRIISGALKRRGRKAWQRQIL